MSLTIPSSPELTDDDIEILDASMEIDMISDDEDELPECSMKHCKSVEKSTSNESFTPPKASDAVEISSDEDDIPLKHSKWKKYEFDATEVKVKCEPKCETGVESDVKNVKPEHVQYIGGVPVKFPFKPYSAQIAVMFKVILGLTKRENCLLESPTGSGKTLALLCASLAWQAKEKERIKKLYEENYFKDAHAQPPRRVKREPDEHDGSGAAQEEFQKRNFGSKNVYDPMDVNNVKKERQDGKVKIETDEKENGCAGSPVETEHLVKIHHKRKTTDDEERSSEEYRVPRIYYGARTHKQIGQVVRELKLRCSYSALATAVTLGSREYCCLRELDTKLFANKNEMCREVIKPIRDKKNKQSEQTGCPYYDGRKQLFNVTRGEILELEELVAQGEEKCACPYFAARHRATVVDIVFCPYNYLIDPSIRSSMQLDLTDEIVIIDEAHNIEDVCREAAGLQFNQEQLQKSCVELATVRTYQSGELGEDLTFLILYLKDWDTWFANHLPLVRDKPLVFGEAVFTWDIRHFVSTLDNHNLGLDKYPDLCRCTDHLSRRVKEDSLRLLHAVKTQTVSLLESFCTTFGYLFRDGLKYMDDFKPALVKTAAFRRKDYSNNWTSTDDDDESAFITLTVRLVCLNSGVIFSELNKCRSVVLASGTLTPSHSIASELQTNFKHQVFADHVISRERVWVGTVSSWDGVKLECTYRAQGSVGFQDALGSALLHVCKVTPGGVLAFFPSYSLRDKLIQRWKQTRLWEQMNELKQVFAESRNIRDHNDVMEGYVYAAECDSRGAILLAIYRGKVSEGMDFRDAQARCVVVIGVPYPNVNEMSVESKMKYNDCHAKDRNLLPSSEWLKVQAYRALNQAAGRCVRHCNDWGAVLLVDHRFSFAHFTQHLSKWILNFLDSNHHTSESLLRSDNPRTISKFMEKMKIQENT